MRTNGQTVLASLDQSKRPGKSVGILLGKQELRYQKTPSFKGTLVPGKCNDYCGVFRVVLGDTFSCMTINLSQAIWTEGQQQVSVSKNGLLSEREKKKKPLLHGVPMQLASYSLLVAGKSMPGSTHRAASQPSRAGQKGIAASQDCCYLPQMLLLLLLPIAIEQQQQQQQGNALTSNPTWHWEKKKGFELFSLAVCIFGEAEREEK